MWQLFLSSFYGIDRQVTIEIVSSLFNAAG
jgi:hypothetical protein